MAVPVVINGGFETGDHTGWVLQGFDLDQDANCFGGAFEGNCFWYCMWIE